MTPRLRVGLATMLWGLALGTLILGAGSRIAMHLVAEITAGTGGFTLGGTLAVVFLGTANGALGAAVLLVARTLRRWPPAPSLLYWGALLALTLRGLSPLDPLRIALFLPLVLAFGLLLQWVTWGYRQARPAAPQPL